MDKNARPWSLDNSSAWLCRFAMQRTIITILLALVTVAGQAQVKCHVERTLETDAWGDEVILCEAGTDLRVVDEPRFHVNDPNGIFPQKRSIIKRYNNKTK